MTMIYNREIKLLTLSAGGVEVYRQMIGNMAIGQVAAQIINRIDGHAAEQVDFDAVE